MGARSFGEPVRRNEDARLLTGRATFIDDVRLPDMLHAALLRSPYAHARVLGIDASAARARTRATARTRAGDRRAARSPAWASGVTGASGRLRSTDRTTCSATRSGE